LWQEAARTVRRTHTGRPRQAVRDRVVVIARTHGALAT